ncbi:hypothetical protein [Amycolatopsis jejuensis]|uniref:hypothetical protein n=1 Tax=Amycolatopsis jejuensis TaxID=330084 RepID=UPI0012E0B66F|nr:hypothetical protein [Amycolatopsis jejuensis]
MSTVVIAARQFPMAAPGLNVLFGPKPALSLVTGLEYGAVQFLRNPPGNFRRARSAVRREFPVPEFRHRTAVVVT